MNEMESNVWCIAHISIWVNLGLGKGILLWLGQSPEPLQKGMQSLKEWTAKSFEASAPVASTAPSLRQLDQPGQALAIGLLPGMNAVMV